MTACLMGSFKIVKMLVEAGSDFNSTNKYGENAFMLAAAVG